MISNDNILNKHFRQAYLYQQFLNIESNNIEKIILENLPQHIRIDSNVSLEDFDYNLLRINLNTPRKWLPETEKILKDQLGLTFTNWEISDYGTHADLVLDIDKEMFKKLI